MRGRNGPTDLRVYSMRPERERARRRARKRTSRDTLDVDGARHVGGEREREKGSQIASQNSRLFHLPMTYKSFVQ